MPPQICGFYSIRVLAFDFLQMISATIPDIEILNILYPRDVPAAAFIHFENVNNFTIHIAENIAVPDQFPLTFANLTTLEIIAPTFSQIPLDLILQTTSLKSLSLPITRYEIFATFTNLLNKLPHLEEIKLKWTNDISYGETLNLITRKNKLMKISFFTWTKLSQDDLLTIIPSNWEVVQKEKVKVDDFDLYEVTIERKRNPLKRMFEAVF